MFTGKAALKQSAEESSFCHTIYFCTGWNKGMCIYIEPIPIMSHLIIITIDPVHVHSHGFCVTWLSSDLVNHIKVHNKENGNLIKDNDIEGSSTYAYVEGLEPKTQYTCVLTTQDGCSEQIDVTTHRLDDSYICKTDAAEFYHDNDDLFTLDSTYCEKDQTYTLQWTPPYPNIDHTIVHVIYYYGLGRTLRLVATQQTWKINEYSFVVDSNQPPFYGGGAFTCDVTIIPVLRPTMIFGQAMTTSLIMKVPQRTHFLRLP